MTYDEWGLMLMEALLIVSGLLIAIWIGIKAVSGIVKAIRNFGL
jgi:hypothetical protein